MLARQRNYFAEKRSGSEAGSYLRRIVYHSTLGSRVRKQKKKDLGEQDGGEGSAEAGGEGLVEWLCHVTVLYVPCFCLIYAK